MQCEQMEESEFLGWHIVPPLVLSLIHPCTKIDGLRKLSFRKCNKCESEHNMSGIRTVNVVRLYVVTKCDHRSHFGWLFRRVSWWTTVLVITSGPLVEKNGYENDLIRNDSDKAARVAPAVSERENFVTPRPENEG